MRARSKQVERKKFASKAEISLLETMYSIADAEGKKFFSVLEEAMRCYIEGKKNKRTKGKKNE